MARDRGAGSALIAVGAFLASCVMWFVSLSAPDPAESMARSPLCSAADSAPDAGCRRVLAATVDAVGLVPPSDHRDGEASVEDGAHWVRLRLDGATAAGPTLEFAEADWPGVAVLAGDRLTATQWSGKIVTVTTAHGTAAVLGDAPPARFPLVTLSLLLMIVALVLARAGVPAPEGPGSRSAVPFADRVLLPAWLVSLVVFYLHRERTTVWGVVVTGSLLITAYLAAMERD